MYTPDATQRDVQSKYLWRIPRLDVESLALSCVASHDAEIGTCDRKDRSPVFRVRVKRSLRGSRFCEEAHGQMQDA